jgi:hypothetical protein
MKHLFLCFLGVAALGTAAWADPPGRVGRLSYLEGTVSFLPADGESLQAATMNLPLTAGNGLSTGDGSRAEVHIGSAAVRLGPNTQVSIVALDDSAVRLRLDRGVTSIRLRWLAAGQSFQVDTRTAQVSLDALGLYRIEQKDAGDATVTTRAGDAEVTGGQTAFHVGEGQTAAIPASGPDAYWISAAPALDAWDEWVASRDGSENTLASTQYVPRELDGVEDLDRYGTWQYSPSYGYAWCPSGLPLGWAPYTVGHWVWLVPWGWTWVDYEPWGFAPFHYGRWAFVSGLWCWVPGSFAAGPVFAPALVTWVGGAPWRGHPPDGDHVSWVPLQPHQPYRPAYPVSSAYLRGVNGTAVLPPHTGGPAAVVAGAPAPFVPGRPGVVARTPAGPSAALTSRVPVNPAPARTVPTFAPPAPSPSAAWPTHSPVAATPYQAPRVQRSAPPYRPPAVSPHQGSPAIPRQAIPSRGGAGRGKGGFPWWWDN